MNANEKPTRKQRALRWAREIALTLVVGVILLFGLSWLRAPDLGMAPDFTLLDLEGRPVSLSDFRGQTVVVNFWATWCTPTRSRRTPRRRWSTPTAACGGCTPGSWCAQ